MINYHAQAMDRETKPPPGAPHGWVQWKGTDVCMDVLCICGAHGHVDSDFPYFVRCNGKEGCGRVYAVSGYVELVELTPEEKTACEADSPSICNINDVVDISEDGPGE